jgi:heme/copper-type cytochrome/quinol oxidase subunit 2
MVLQPNGVVGPSGMSSASFATSVPANTDLSDAWLTFTSDQPLVVWGAVNDNGSTDSTAVPAFNDSDPVTTPVQTTKTVTISAHSFDFTVTPPLSNLKVGDQVTFRITATDPLHGFKLVSPDGATKIADTGTIPVGTTIEKTVTLNIDGTWAYLCTQANCGTGHSFMVGTFDVAKAAAAEVIQNR